MGEEVDYVLLMPCIRHRQLGVTRQAQPVSVQDGSEPYSKSHSESCSKPISEPYSKRESESQSPTPSPMPNLIPSSPPSPTSSPTPNPNPSVYVPVLDCLILSTWQMPGGPALRYEGKIHRGDCGAWQCCQGNIQGHHAYHA